MVLTLYNHFVICLSIS